MHWDLIKLKKLLSVKWRGSSLPAPTVSKPSSHIFRTSYSLSGPKSVHIMGAPLLMTLDTGHGFGYSYMLRGGDTVGRGQGRLEPPHFTL